MNIIRLVYLPEWCSTVEELVIIGPVFVALPLLPLMLPLYWLILNHAGSAILLSMFKAMKTQQVNYHLKLGLAGAKNFVTFLVPYSFPLYSEKT